MHGHAVEAPGGVDDDAVMGRDALDAGEHVFHLRGEHVRAADDEHVVGARAHLPHARVGAAAGARLAGDAREVVRAVAQDGDGLLAERREHKLALLAVGHRLAGFGIDHLPEEVVLGDVLHVAAGQALARHARPHDLGEAVVVGAHDVHAALDLGLEARRARLAAEQAHAQRRGLPVEPHSLTHLAHVQRVGGRGHEHGGAVVLDHGDVPLGVARAGGDHHAAQLLQPVVQSEAAGEHAVAERHLRAVAGHDARHLHEAHDAVGPQVHVMGVVAHDDGLSRGARGGVQLHHLVERHGEQAVGEGVAQHGLVRERELAHVFERLDVGGRHALLVHARAVPRYALVDPGHLLDEAGQLDGPDALARGAFDGGVVDGQLGEIARRRSGQGRAFRGHVGHAPHRPSPRARGAASAPWPTSSTGSEASSSSARPMSSTDSAM